MDRNKNLILQFNKTSLKMKSNLKSIQLSKSILTPKKSPKLTSQHMTQFSKKISSDTFNTKRTPIKPKAHIYTSMVEKQSKPNSRQSDRSIEHYENMNARSTSKRPKSTSKKILNLKRAYFQNKSSILKALSKLHETPSYSRPNSAQGDPSLYNLRSGSINSIPDGRKTHQKPSIDNTSKLRTFINRSYLTGGLQNGHDRSVYDRSMPHNSFIGLMSTYNLNVSQANSGYMLARVPDCKKKLRKYFKKR